MSMLWICCSVLCSNLMQWVDKNNVYMCTRVAHRIVSCAVHSAVYWTLLPSIWRLPPLPPNTPSRWWIYIETTQAHANVPPHANMNQLVGSQLSWFKIATCWREAMICPSMIDWKWCQARSRMSTGGGWGHMSTFISAAISHCQPPYAAPEIFCRRAMQSIPLQRTCGPESGCYYQHKEAEAGHRAEKLLPLSDG